MEKQQAATILNSSKTAEAINYCLRRRDKLTNYLNYSFLTPDTNAAERAVKPFVMARKNFLFSGSGTGAGSTCLMFTLIETAKANSKNPEDYLRCLFEKAPYARTAEDWKKLNYDAFEPMKKKRQVGFYRQNNFVKIKRVLPLYLADTML